MWKRVLVAVAGGIGGWLIGSLASHLTAWPWWVRICVAVGPAIALLIAERKRIVRTPEELNRPLSILGDGPPDVTRDASSREDGNSL